MKFTTREEWLNAAAQAIRPLFDAQGAADYPRFRVSCGFPKGGRKAIGQAWTPEASGDDTAELFISPELEELVRKLGSAISRSAPSNRYATLLFIDLDHATDRLRYVNAGHAPLPMHVQPSGAMHELPAGGTPLGLFPEYEYAVDELRLGPGEFVFACTDGVTDLENPAGEMYGEQRLRELLSSAARRTAFTIFT